MVKTVRNGWSRIANGPGSACGAARWVAVILTLLSHRLQAGDWPQILGPSRNGVAVDEPELTVTSAGPRERWHVDAGQGMAGVAVVGNRVYLFHRIDDNDLLESRDAQTGDLVWKQSYATDYACSYTSDAGPRCVPCVAGDRIITYSAAGYLRCLAADAGRTIWERDTRQEFDPPEGYFGVGTTPVIFDDLVIVNVGGRGDGGIVAFRLQDGSVAWTIPGETASYSAPVIADVEGSPRLCCVTRLHFVFADPRSGQVITRLPFGARGPTVNAASPLLLGPHLFLTASYGVGARWIALQKERASQVWERHDLLSSQYSTAVEHEGMLYGIDGREDVGSATLRAIDPHQPQVLWEKQGFGMAVPLRVGNKVLLIKTDGELVVMAANRERYEELSRTRLTTQLIRALPAFSQSQLWVRDGQTLRCFAFPSR